MPSKHISALDQKYHERLLWLEHVTEQAASFMSDHHAGEEPGDILDLLLLEMRDVLAELIGLPDDYADYLEGDIPFDIY